MPRSNLIYLVVGALIVATAVLGYQVYQDRQSHGVEIKFGPNGVSVDGK